MSLLKQVVKEMAVTGAHAVAVAPGGLFGGGDMYNPYLSKKKRKKGKMLRRVIPHAINVQESTRLSESLGLSTDETNFNAADVVSKLDAAEKKVKAEDDTVSFGLEDEDGQLVRVYVRSEQAQEFEMALASMLGAADENDDNVNSSLEIAEVLFDLKNRFEIVDVDWGDIEADEEEEQEVEGDEADLEGGEEGDMDAEMQAPDGEMGELGDEMGGDMMGGMGGEDEDMKSTLQQVIDMLKSNAEAQKAEAEAKAAEAKAKEAEFAAKAAEAKIKQEEQVLDMEAYYKKKQDQEKEAKRLAKLAKFKHDQAADAESSLSSSSYSFESVELTKSEEDEEDVLTPLEIARLIFHNLQARN
jgi:hypothetical protein